MSKDKKNNNKPLIVGAVLGAVVLLFAVTIFAFKNQRFSGLEAFPVDAFQNAPGNHMGNRYLLEAQIDSLILWEQGTGRLLAVNPNGYSGRLPVYVPESVSDSLHVGQRYRMAISVETGGLLHVDDLEKY